LRTKIPLPIFLSETNLKQRYFLLVLIVHRTINDSARHKRNVVVTGLSESTDCDDRSSFMAFCEEHLPIKPALSDNCCTRLSTKQTGRPRPQLVKLSSDEVASSILRAAPSLSHSTDPYVACHIYMSCTWSPHHILKIQQVETVQRKFTKRLPGYASLCYKVRLSLLDLDSLEMRWLRHDLLYTYKIVFSLVSEAANDMFTLANTVFNSNSRPSVQTILAY